STVSAGSGALLRRAISSSRAGRMVASRWTCSSILDTAMPISFAARRSRLQVELAVLGSAHEGVPLGLGEQQDRSLGVPRVAYRDRVVDEGHLDPVVRVRIAGRTRPPDRAAEVHPEPFGLNFHHKLLCSLNPYLRWVKGRSCNLHGSPS